jgi:ribonucleoside-diphosphate reductase alpha chain
MRNSNTMAIAPTATISNISGCYPCIEPIYKNIYVKANISGEFTIVNSYLIEDLKQLGLWNEAMLEMLKFRDGNLAQIDVVPQELKVKYREAFDIDPVWCLKMTAVRAKWIDQSQSHNVFMKGASGKKLHEIYTSAWKMGLKTTYYLRTLAASQVEKSTLDAGKYGYTQRREVSPAATAPASTESTATGGATTRGATVAAATAEPVPVAVAAEPTLCRIDDPECEACQ